MVANQDFDHRLTIVARPDLPSWQSMNAVAHVAAYLGHQMTDRFDTGEWFVTKDGIRLPRNTQYAIIILRADRQRVNDFLEPAQEHDLIHLGLVRDMIDTTNDQEIEIILSHKSATDVEYLAVGAFAPNDRLKKITFGLALWK
ncbi:MAG: DUF2000 family protein [Candidatus Kerfeldbacteria bacterium]|nr:DUF2000 family protein [Candidatus Kerfeldbacteria bacterium]